MDVFIFTIIICIIAGWWGIKDEERKKEQEKERKERLERLKKERDAEVREQIDEKNRKLYQEKLNKTFRVTTKVYFCMAKWYRYLHDRLDCFSFRAEWHF